MIKKKKPMLIDFSVYEGCHRCEFMQKYVYSNDEIVDKINSDFIPIIIDLAKTLTPEEKSLGEKYDYQEDCLLLFLNHNKEVIHNQDDGKMCFADKIEPKVFINYLNYILNTYAQSNTN
jgi:hypothetical protein